VDDRGLLQLARGEQPRQLGVDAGEALLGVGGGVAGGGVAGGAAERRGGGEEALGVLGLGELVAVVGDDELETELTGRGGGQRGAPPQLAHLAAERREIGLRPLARGRRRRSGCVAALPALLSAQLLDGVFVEVDEPHETAGGAAAPPPPSTRSSLSSFAAHSSGQSGLMQIHRQPSASAWLRLGSSGSPQESQMRAKSSGMGTSLGRG